MNCVSTKNMKIKDKEDQGINKKILFLEVKTFAYV
jgi:hypothetical protein